MTTGMRAQVRVTFDEGARALYLALVFLNAGDAQVARSVAFAPNVNLDLNAAGQVVGIELLGSDSE